MLFGKQINCDIETSLINTIWLTKQHFPISNISFALLNVHGISLDGLKPVEMTFHEDNSAQKLYNLPAIRVGFFVFDHGGLSTASWNVRIVIGENETK